MRAPAIILVRPQMGENIGAAARVMQNFGLSELRLVRPRDGWPNPVAVSMAKHATPVIEAVQVFDSVAEAVADRQQVFASTGRDHKLAKPVFTPRQMVEAMNATPAQKAAILLGAERNGLTNEELDYADQLVTIPTDSAYDSLNLAQAVAVNCYEWRTGQGATPVDEGEEARVPAPKSALGGLFEHLESALEGTGFFKTPEIKPTMIRNLRAMLTRAQYTEQEVQTLRGVIRSLSSGRR